MNGIANNSRISRKMAAYSAVAVVLLGNITNADASITVVDIVPDQVLNGPTEAFVLDMDGDLTNDFVFNIFTMGSGTFDTGKGTAYGTNGFVGAAGALSNFSSGVMIGSSDAFIGTGIFGVYSAYFTSGNFIGTSNVYVGLKVKVSGTIRYGWMEVSVNANISQYTILQYAYSDEPGLSIMTGQLVGMVDSKTKDESTQVYSFGKDINVKLAHNRTRGKVSVFDMTGKRVNHADLLRNNTRISVKGTKGIYVVKVESEGKMSTTKVYLD